MKAARRGWRKYQTAWFCKNRVASSPGHPHSLEISFTNEAISPAAQSNWLIFGRVVTAPARLRWWAANLSTEVIQKAPTSSSCPIAARTSVARALASFHSADSTPPWLPSLRGIGSFCLLTAVPRMRDARWPEHGRRPESQWQSSRQTDGRARPSITISDNLPQNGRPRTQEPGDSNSVNEDPDSDESQTYSTPWCRQQARPGKSAVQPPHQNRGCER